MYVMKGEIKETWEIQDYEENSDQEHSFNFPLNVFSVPSIYFFAYFFHYILKQV